VAWRVVWILLLMATCARGEELEFLPERVDLLTAVWHADGRCEEVGLTRRSQGRGVTLTVPDGAAWGGFPLVRLTPEVVQELKAAGATGLGLHDPRPEHLALLAGLPQLRVLHVRNARRLHDADLAQLSVLTDLRQLQLEGAEHLTSEGLAHLARLESLDLLRLTGAVALGGAPLKQLAPSALTQLDLSGCGWILGLEGGEPLALRRLVLDGCRSLGDGALRALGGQSNLRALSLQSCPLTDDALQHLPGSLSELRLGDTAITDAGLVRLLARLEALEALSLAACPLLSAEISKSLARCQALRRLDLREATWLGEQELAALASLPLLEELDLSGGTLTGADLRGLKGARALTTLALNDCRKLDDAAGPALAELGGLERLELSGTPLGDEAISALGSLGSLRELDLSRSPRLGNAGLASLHELALESLSLAGCPLIGPAGLRHLTRLTSLEALDLVGCRIGGEDLATLRAALPQCKIRSLE